MELNYAMKTNGLPILSKDDIEELAARVLHSFAPSVLSHPKAVDIDMIAYDNLFLTVKNHRLSSDASILGITVFNDIEERADLNEYCNIDIELPLPAGTIVIDSSLTSYNNQPRRRYTLAHECAHWILHRTYHSPNNQQYKFRKQRLPYIVCRDTSIEIKRYTFTTDSDWLEWQADTLAAALLMPYNTFKAYAQQYIYFDKRRYLSIVSYEYIEIIEDVANRFKVSKRAAEIRLMNMGLIILDEPSRNNRQYR